MRRGKRWTRRSPLIPLSAVVLAYAAFFGVRAWYRNSVRQVTQVPAPDGKMTDWRGLLDWAQCIGADAFWMLGGQTPGPGDGQVWVSVNFDMIPKVAAEARRRGLKFGVYAECYLTMTKDGRQV